MENTSPVVVCDSLATAPMSPAGTSATESCSFPLRVNSCPTRSSVPFVALNTAESGRIVPENTRNIVMWPTYGSETVLNTRAVSGCEGSQARCFSSPDFDTTVIGPRSTGEGNSSTMNWRIRSTPMGRAAAATNTGAIRASANPFFTPWTTSSSDSSPCSRYFSMSASSDSATASMSFSRNGSALPEMSSGHGPSSARGPEGYRNARRVRRSAMPSNSCSSPRGSSSGATCVPKARTSCSNVRSNEARSLSSLLTRMARGSPASTASSQATSVWTSTPSTADTTSSTASTAWMAERRSPTKSAYPGASRTFTLTSFHSTGAMASETLSPFLTSSGSKSETVLPSSTLPIRVTAPEAKSIASISDVFPAPPWPARRTLRMFVGS